MRQLIRTKIWMTLTTCLLASAMCSSMLHAEPTTLQALTADLYKSTPGPTKFDTIDETWTDDARKREVPVRIYLPNIPARTKAPVLIFSHGCGASRNNYAYFCTHMASEGYIVIVPTHHGSDTASISLGGGENSAHGLRALLKTRAKLKAAGEDKTKDVAADPAIREGLTQSINDPANLKNRPKDVSFVIDQLSINPKLKDIADLNRIGVAGHSFGAYTAMAIGGMRVDLPEGKSQSLADPRVKAVLPMSPEGHGTMGISPGAWNAFAVPVLFLTGTKDYGSGNQAASWRREGFDAIPSVDHYLIIITDATHMTFGHPSGFGGLIRRSSGDPSNGRNEQLIDASATAFFDAYLNNDAQAKAWLKDFFATKHPECTAEFAAPQKK